MAIKNIIAKGVGFSPGGVNFIVTHGFAAGAAVVVGKAPPYVGRANWQIRSRLRSRRFAQQSLFNDALAGEGLAVTASTGLVDIQQGTSTALGGFFQIAADIDITDNSGGSATSTIAAMTNVDTLTDSTTGPADDTVAAISGSGDDTNINNNFKEIVDQILTQESLNTALINSVASLAAEVNDLKSKMRTSGVLDS